MVDPAGAAADPAGAAAEPAGAAAEPAGAAAESTGAAAEPETASIGQTVARGSAWSLLGQGVSLSTAIVATPFTIRLLGPSRYGIWSLLQSVMSWVGLADFGMSSASTRMAGERLAQADDAGEVTFVWTAAAITVTATAVAGAAVAWWAPYVLSHLLHVRGHLLGPAVVALRLMAVATVGAAAAGTLNTPLLTRFDWRRNTIITTAGGLLQVVGVPLILSAVGGGVITAASVYLASALLSSAAIFWVAVRLQPAMTAPRVSRAASQKLLHYGLALTVAGIATIPLTTAERFFLGHDRSVIEVAYYAVAWRLATMLTVIPTAICQPLFPAFVALEGRGESAAAKVLYRQILQALFMLLTPVALLMAFIGHPFLSLWAGAAYGAHSTAPFLVLLGSSWFNALAWLPIYYLSLDRTRLIAAVNAFQLLPYLVAAALLTSAFGVIGAAIASGSRDVVDALILFWLSRREAGLPLSPLTERKLRAISAPILLTGILVGISLGTSGLAVRAACGVSVVAVYYAVSWRTVLSRREQTALRSLLAGIGPIGRILTRASAA